jgi:SAM-dependent methyltransferase
MMKKALADVPKFPRFRWPKNPHPLSPEAQQVHDDFVKLWLQTLPTRSYGVIEKFNHSYPLRFLPETRPFRTLEIGAGIGNHLACEDLAIQEYHCIELRENVAAELRERFPNVVVTVADCQKRLPYPDGYFDRAVVVHVLEHLPDLPSAAAELRRVLKPDALLSLLIPCDPGLAYEIARKSSAERVFRRHFNMPYRWIARREHLNNPAEILSVLEHGFREIDREYYPLRWLPVMTLNLFIGLTYARAGTG